MAVSLCGWYMSHILYWISNVDRQHAYVKDLYNNKRISIFIGLTNQEEAISLFLQNYIMCDYPTRQ